MNLDWYLIANLLQYYTDPVSGYVFRSRKDVFRYLKTGEISRHAFKPKNKCINVPELANDEISVSLHVAKHLNLLEFSCCFT